MPDFDFEQLSPHPRMTAYLIKTWSQPEGFVAERVLPQLDVDDKTFEYPYYSSTRTQRVFETRAADTGELPIMNFAFPEFKEAKTTRHGLKTAIPDAINYSQHVPEWASQEVAIDELRRAMKREIDQALHDALILKAAESGAFVSPTVKWDALSGTITIRKNWLAAKRAFQNRLGRPPSFAIVGSSVIDVLANSSEVNELRKYTDPNLLTDGSLPPKLWGTPVVEADNFVDVAKAGKAQDLQPVFSEDNIYFIYVDTNIMRNRAAATAYAMWRWAKWGVPLAAKIWRPEARDVEKTWVAVESHYEIKEVAPTCVYTLTDVLA